MITLPIETHSKRIPLDEWDNHILLTPLDNTRIIDLHVNDEDITDEVADEVSQQLCAYITAIASIYRPHPFHNFRRASKRVQTMDTLLRQVRCDATHSSVPESSCSLEETALGFATDPLLCFALCLAMLICDVDHPGVDNDTWARENPALARYYRHQFIAEQNAIDVAWQLLFSEEYGALQNALFGVTFESDDEDKSECRRFRRILVHAVLATSDKPPHQDRKVCPDGNESDEKQAKESQRARAILHYLVQVCHDNHSLESWDTFIKNNEA